MCVCVRYQFVQEHVLLNEFLLLYLCIWVFLMVCVCVCVHPRPQAPHHQDTGLNGGSYSPFPTLLSQQVAPNVLFSLRKLLAFLLFLCSYLFFFISHLLSHSLSCLLSLLLLLSRFWLCLLLLLKTLSLFIFLSFISGSLPSRIGFLGSKKTVTH